ncbi:hypothetical protein PVAND_006174 [Polypedilum vanderplanki]|uniref:NADP-dependent oxidoreductase domain-containing protein n=1 Tax=Polypedilum vanderplanki TaxID=319348 RepID=A0A9J6C2T2_POLVA|nr:hypothetical protein PVAND_006174 [Polypedilum vanderplanki]
MSVPSVELSNGFKIPMLGLGTWLSPVGQVEQAVKDAIDAGYRHIDGAYVYRNEAEVGNAIAAKIDEGIVTREELFVTSKLWNIFHDPKHVRGALEKTLQDLKLNYIDLYLIHFPMGLKFIDSETLSPKTENGEWMIDTIDHAETWKAMEELVDEGLVISIGLSNFNSKQIEYILSNANIKPVMLQCECHPYLNQKKLIEFCHEKGIAFTAYSPLGSNSRPSAKPDDPQLMEDPTILQISEKHSKTPAQILLRWQIQRGVIAIPKSVTKSRIISNFDIFDFELDEEDMENIDGLNRNERLIAFKDLRHHPNYPFGSNVEF